MLMAGRIVRTKSLSDDAVSYTALNVNVNVPSSVGVPEIVPELNAIPSGKSPLMIDHVAGVLSEANVRV